MQLNAEIQYASTSTEVIRDIVHRANIIYDKVDTAFGQSRADAAVRKAVRGLCVDEQTIQDAVDCFEQFLEDQQATEDFDRIHGEGWWIESPDN